MNSPRSAWLIYTVLRLLFFAVPFAVLYWLGIWPWLSAIFAALIGVSLSIILLSKPRAVASESIYDWRTRERTADDIVEDDAVEAAESDSMRADGSESTSNVGSGTVESSTVKSDAVESTTAEPRTDGTAPSDKA